MLQNSSRGNIGAEQRPEDAEDPVARRDCIHLFIRMKIFEVRGFSP